MGPLMHRWPFTSRCQQSNTLLNIRTPQVIFDRGKLQTGCPDEGHAQLSILNTLGEYVFVFCFFFVLTVATYYLAYPMSPDGSAAVISVFYILCAICGSKYSGCIWSSGRSAYQEINTELFTWATVCQWVTVCGCVLKKYSIQLHLYAVGQTTHLSVL